VARSKSRSSHALSLASVSAQAADVGDVQVVVRRAIEGDPAPCRENCDLVRGIDTCHQQRRDLDVTGIPAGRHGALLYKAAVLCQGLIGADKCQARWLLDRQLHLSLEAAATQKIWMVVPSGT